MKKKLITLVLVLALAGIQVHAEQGKISYYEWSVAPAAQKVGIVEGWLYAAGLFYNFKNELQTALEKNIILYKPIQNEKEVKATTELFKYTCDCEYMGFMQTSGLELFQVTVGQIIGVIDEIYNDPRVRNWEIHEIFPLVRGRLKEGWSKDDLDDVISYLLKEKNLAYEFINNPQNSPDFLKRLKEVVNQLPAPLKRLRSYSDNCVETKVKTIN